MARRRAQDDDENTSALDAHYSALADQMAAMNSSSSRDNPSPALNAYVRIRGRRRR